MDIAAMNVRIKLQKNEIVTDKYGNHKNEWSDYFSCYATLGGTTDGGVSGAERHDAGQTVDVSSPTFTVRYSSETAAVDITHYRILYNDEIYNIVSIDWLNMKKRALKFKCRKERR